MFPAEKPSECESPVYSRAVPLGRSEPEVVGVQGRAGGGGIKMAAWQRANGVVFGRREVRL